jgi:hypothetical protein
MNTYGQHPERNRDIVERVKAGETNGSIAARHGISRARVAQIAWQYGRVHSQHGQPWSEERRQRWFDR